MLLLAGITDCSGPRLLRHTFATHALRARPNLRAVQELLGHAWVTFLLVMGTAAERTYRYAYTRLRTETTPATAEVVSCLFAQSSVLT